MQLCKEQNSSLHSCMSLDFLSSNEQLTSPPLFHTLYCCYISKTTLQHTAFNHYIAINVLTVSTTVVKWSRGKWDKSPTITRLWNVSAFTGSAWRFTKYTACSNSVSMHFDNEKRVLLQWDEEVQIYVPYTECVRQWSDHTKYNTYNWPGRRFLIAINYLLF